MRADAYFEAAVDGSRLDGLFHVTPATLEFQELSVAEGEVLGAQVGIRAARELLADEVLLSHGTRECVQAETEVVGDAVAASPTVVAVLTSAVPQRFGTPLGWPHSPAAPGMRRRGSPLPTGRTSRSYGGR